MIKKLLLLIITVLIAECLNAQQIPVVEKTDTAKVYKDIEAFSKRKGLTKFIYGLVFKSTVKATRKKRKSTVWTPLVPASFTKDKVKTWQPKVLHTYRK